MQAFGETRVIFGEIGGEPPQAFLATLGGGGEGEGGVGEIFGHIESQLLNIVGLIKPNGV